MQTLVHDTGGDSVKQVEQEFIGAAQAFMFGSALEVQSDYLLAHAAGHSPLACVVDGDATTTWKRG